jgi:hypothetical protein
MMSLEIFKKKLPIGLFLGAIMILSGILAIKNLYFLFTYNIHEGYEKGVFGSPIPLRHSLFNALYWMAALIGSFTLFLFKRIGWILSQVIAISGCLTLLFAIVMSLFTPLDYFKWPYLILLALGGYFVLILNSDYLLKVLSLKRDFGSYKLILIGILILGTLAASLFDIFSVYS